MLGRIGGGAAGIGCPYGRRCTCNTFYNSKAMRRHAKRSERNSWKRDLNA